MPETLHALRVHVHTTAEDLAEVVQDAIGDHDELLRFMLKPEALYERLGEAIEQERIG